LRGGPVNVQVRLAVPITMVMPGRIVRQVTLGGFRVHRRRGARFMFVSIANHGNVTEQLRGHVTISLYRRGKVARLRLLAPPALPPGTRGLFALRYRGRLRGPVTALVRVRLDPALQAVERRYRIRL
jgi:hypothetical protein